MNITDIRTPVAINGGDWVEKFGAIWRDQAQALQQQFGASIVEVQFPGEAAVDMLTVTVKKESLIQVLDALKNNPKFDYAQYTDMTATDETEHPRFCLVYHLYSYSRKNRIRVKTRIAEDESAPTATKLWEALNWAEREVWDMFGIRFDGHPDLRRILLDERWVGHPLRKDYPIRGYQIFTEPEDPQPHLLKD